MIRRPVSAALLLTLVAFTWLAPVAPRAVAAACDVPTAATTTVAAGDSWAGVVSAVVCGLFIKATVATAGTSAGVWAGTIASCAFTFFDALFEPD